MTEIPIERPLTPWAKTGLIASTTAIVLLFYILVLVSGILIAALLILELTPVIALLRFGLAGWMIRIMEAHVRVIGILLRSLWLRRGGAEYRIPLHESDSPALFQILRRLSDRLEVAPPNEAVLEMSVNAWVHLKGFRSGAGSTRLGIGYDLLAGLTVSELEAVLAHEMAHAKLIQRGFTRFANGALARCANLVSILSAHVTEGRDRNQPRHVAAALLSVTDALIRILARLVAAYSRQGEFEADHGAAEICGPNAIRSSLRKLGALGEASRRLPWRERVARLQSGESYSEWFAKQITASLQNAPVGEAADLVFDRYSTHPLLAHRIAALPPDLDQECNNAPAVTLLADPDAIIERLITEIQRVAALEEEKDSKRVAKWTRAAGRRTAVRPLQWLAIIIGVLGLLGGIIGIPIGLAIAVLLYRKGRYRDPFPLPIPEYAQLVTPGPQPKFDQQKKMEADLSHLAAREKRKKRKAILLAQESYKALAAGDYLRAHVAARVCFKFDPKSIEGHVAFAVAAAGVNQNDASARALRYVRSHTGFRTDSTAWGAAWSLILLHDWVAAEALLESLIKRNPKQTTFQCLLALVRSRRGKFNSAIEKARQACTPSPRDKEQAHLLISLLLDAGLHREAAARLSAIESTARVVPGLQMQMVRLKLLTGDLAAAEYWTNLALQSDPRPQRRIHLATHYLQAHALDRAAGFLTDSLKQGHYPEALVGLADVEIERRNYAAAREHLLAALDFKKPVAEGATAALQFVPAIIARLTNLEPLTHCQAWNAALPAHINCAPPFKSTSYLVFAPTLEAGQKIVSTICGAMDSTFPATALIWKPAPRDQQPARPVHPGIQRVLSIAPHAQ